MTDIAVIGAGPAGVSVALSLRDRGLRPLLIDRADHVASSWRGRYDRLKLNTGRPFSHLPKRPYPKGTAMFPTRDEVVAHLDRHARESGIELRLGTEVTRIDRQATVGDWKPRPATSTRARSSWRSETSTPPRIPEWPGADGFTGEVLHSSEYRNPHPYQGSERIGGRLRLVGHGDRARPCDRWCGKVWLPSALRRTSCCGHFPAVCRATWSLCRCTTCPSASPTRSAEGRGA